MKAVVVGNPNSGKTTFFNMLTGKNLPVGNRPGVTVEAVKANYKEWEIYDLPGTYSLFSPRGEERAAAIALTTLDPDVVLNVVDAKYLARSLYLTEQLISFCHRQRKELIVILNMTEERIKNGEAIDVKALQNALGCPVKTLSLTEKNFDDFFERSDPKSYIVHDQNRAILYDIAEKIERGVVTKIKSNEKKRRNIPFRKIGKNCGNIQKSESFSDKADAILFNKHSSIPFLLAVALVMTIVVSFAAALSNLFMTGTSSLAEAVRKLPLSESFSSFLSEGLLGGIGSVLQFLPLVISLLFFAELAEESGLLARAALLFDPFLSPLGLSGRSAVSFFLGCGCTVPAIMSARTASTERERLKCLDCVHLVPCSAKVPLCAMVFFAVFDTYIVLPLIYLASAVAIVAVNIFSEKCDEDFLMELPALKTPRIKIVASSVMNRSRSFLKRICTVVFFTSIAVWVLSHFNSELLYCDIDTSLLALIGNKIKYLFYPVGLYDWRIAVAIIVGFAGKETTAGTLAVLTGGDLPSLFNPMTATIFIIFILFSPPCAASLSALRKESGKKRFLMTLSKQVLFAYFICSVINVGFIIRELIKTPS